jgi:hypothetical protein
MNVESTVNELTARANADPDLRARLTADPRGTIQAETGMTVPADWDIVILDSADGTIELGFANDEVPDEYLALVSGGLPPESATNHGNRSC